MRHIEAAWFRIVCRVARKRARGGPYRHIDGHGLALVPRLAKHRGVCVCVCAKIGAILSLQLKGNWIVAAAEGCVGEARRILKVEFEAAHARVRDERVA